MMNPEASCTHEQHPLLPTQQHVLLPAAIMTLSTTFTHIIRHHHNHPIHSVYPLHSTITPPPFTGAQGHRECAQQQGGGL
jgi:hypothetical protein